MCHQYCQLSCGQTIEFNTMIYVLGCSSVTLVPAIWESSSYIFEYKFFSKNIRHSQTHIGIPISKNIIKIFSSNLRKKFVKYTFC